MGIKKLAIHWWGSLSKEGFGKRGKMISSFYVDREYPIEEYPYS